MEEEIDSDKVEYVMRRIREDCIHGTSCTIVLIGAHTWGRKYVDWEIKATLDKEHALVGVLLPTASTWLTPAQLPARLKDNVESGYAVLVKWEEFTRSAERMAHYIAEAKSRKKAHINNGRERRLRNG